MLNRVVRAIFKKGKPPEKSAHQLRDVHGKVVDVKMLLQANPARVQSYPANPRAIPLITVEHILEEMKDIVNLTEEHAAVPAMNDEGYTFENLYLETIKRFASYAHVLPASLNWHHYQPGGLLYHSLDVGVRGLMWAKDNAVPRWGHIDQDVKRKPIWVFAAWLGGLLHDSGKILTDVTVVGNNGEVWDPEEETLIDWSVRTKVTSYNYEHKTTRKLKQHERVASEMLSRVISPKARQFLKSSPDNVMDDLKEVLRGYGNSKSYLAKAIREGDYLSTQEDVEKIWEGCLEQRTAALYEQVVKAMTTLQPSWDCNTKDGHIFQLGGHVYLKYPETLDNIINKLKSAGVNTPSSAKNLAEILMDRQILIPASSDSIYGMLEMGKFKKSDIVRKMTAKNEAFKIRVVRISWPGYVFGTAVLPPSITGYVKQSTAWDVTHYMESSFSDYSNEELKEIALEMNRQDETADETSKPSEPENPSTNKSALDKLRQSTNHEVKKHQQTVAKKNTSNETNRPLVNSESKAEVLEKTNADKLKVQPAKKKKPPANTIKLSTDTPESLSEKTKNNLQGSVNTKAARKLPKGLKSQAITSVSEQESLKSDKKPVDSKPPAPTKKKRPPLDFESSKESEQEHNEQPLKQELHESKKSKQESEPDNAKTHDDIIGQGARLPKLPWVHSMVQIIDVTIDELLKNNEFEISDNIVLLSYDKLMEHSKRDRMEIQEHFRNRRSYIHDSVSSRRPTIKHQGNIYVPISDNIVSHYGFISKQLMSNDDKDTSELEVKDVTTETNEQPTPPAQPSDNKNAQTADGTELIEYIISHKEDLSERGHLLEADGFLYCACSTIVSEISRMKSNSFSLMGIKITLRRLNVLPKGTTKIISGAEREVWGIRYE